MSLPNCEVKTNNIQELPDSPAISASELKQLFDKTGKDLKDYLNVLIGEIEKADNNIKKEIQNLVLDTYKYDVVTEVDIDTDEDYTLPTTYKVNTSGLDVYYEGCLLNINKHYVERGTGDSNKIRFGWKVLKGSNLSFVIRK